MGGRFRAHPFNFTPGRVEIPVVAHTSPVVLVVHFLAIVLVPPAPRYMALFFQASDWTEKKKFTWFAVCVTSTLTAGGFVGFTLTAMSQRLSIA